MPLFLCRACLEFFSILRFDMVKDYLNRAVQQRWDIPMVGMVPFGDAMDSATMMDFENLFEVKQECEG